MSVGSESPEPLTTATSGDESIGPAQSIGSNALDVLWHDLRSAFSELTIFGKPADPAKLSIGRSALFYPAVGLSIGLMVSALDWILRTFLTQEITSVLLVGALATLSAGRQLDGFANTADGVIGFRGREWAIATIRDRRLGSSGAAAIAFLLILKVRSLDLLSDPMRFVGILLPPMIGRAAIVALAAGARPAGGSAASARFDPAITSRELMVAGGFVALVSLAFAGALGLLALIVSGLVVVGLRLYYDRRLGGVTAQSLDAGAEILETLMLILFALGS
jgi:adenosylcobinamide-GDP ribazoletransferase